MSSMEDSWHFLSRVNSRDGNGVERQALPVQELRYDRGDWRDKELGLSAGGSLVKHRWPLSIAPDASRLYQKRNAIV